MNRVVVTGLGMITPLGPSAPETFTRLCSNEIGIKEIDGPEYENFYDLPVRVAGLLPIELGIKNYQWLLVETAKEAYKDSGLSDEYEIGAVIGTDNSSFNYLQSIRNNVAEKGLSGLDPRFLENYSISSCINEISKEFCINGYCSVVSSGLATGQASVIQAYNAIKYQHASVILTGSTEDSINPSILMSLYKTGYLSREGEVNSCRPFDVARDGFIYSQGSACLVLESLTHALSRNAKIYCEIVGTGFITNTNKETIHSGPRECMAKAINKAGINGKDISIVNCDASGYRKFDEWEANGVEELCEDSLVTSHKGHLGHMMSASGSCQSAISSLMLKNNEIHPVGNLTIPTVENVNYVCRESFKDEFDYTISNSFSYDAGIFTSIIFKKFKG
jgi:3-oxoacyl-[acyl-carrier-protein] synthase II